LNKEVALKDQMVCVYVAIGQKRSTVFQILETLEREDAMSYTVIVAATASDSGFFTISSRLMLVVL